MERSFSQRHKVLFATSLVAMALGSIHGFSVFLEPLEHSFQASRARVSLTYSLCIICLTLAVLLGPMIYARVHPAVLYLWVAGIGLLGAVIAGLAHELIYVWLGYSVIFGLANGLGYGFGLQFAARANPDYSGLAMGIVTAAYALGAVLAPFGFEYAMGVGGFFTAMIGLGLTVFLAGVAAAILVAQSGAQYAQGSVNSQINRLPHKRIIAIWVAYGTAVAAGLMAIGHAAGIAAQAGFSGWGAATVISACNLLGSLALGWLSDRVSHRGFLTILPVLGGAALLLLTVFPGLTVACLGVVGFAYGGTIATYPAAIARMFPGEDGPRAYGRVFTAWGAAGLLAPWFAGQIFDWSGNYAPALWMAAGLGVASGIAAFRTFRFEE